MLNIRRQKSNVCELPKENYVESRLQALVQPKKKTSAMKEKAPISWKRGKKAKKLVEEAKENIKLV